MKMGIDEVAKANELLQLYEYQKTHILVQILGNMRKLQVADDREGMRKEMDVLRNIMGRIDAVIREQIEKFKDNVDTVNKLAEQKRLVIEITRQAVLYQNSTDVEILNEAYNKMFQAIENFKILSKSISGMKKNYKLAA